MIEDVRSPVYEKFPRFNHLCPMYLRKHPMRPFTCPVNVIIRGSNVRQVTQMMVQPKLKSRYG
jgi:hypothetical protein